MSTDEPRDGTTRRLRYARRTSVLLTVATAAVVSLAGVWGFVVLGAAPAPSSLEDVRLAQADIEPTVGVDALPVEQEGSEDAGVLVTTNEVFLDRDPFSRVIPTAAALQPSSELGSSADPGAPVPPTDPSSMPGTPLDSPPSVVGSVCTGTQELVCDQQVATLVALGTLDGQPSAEVQVDTTTYQVEPGDTFAAGFRLGVIDAPCVTVLYGDEGYRLCTGQSGAK